MSKHDACEERTTAVLKKNPKQNSLFVTNIEKSLAASAMCSEQLRTKLEKKAAMLVGASLSAMISRG